MTLVYSALHNAPQSLLAQLDLSGNHIGGHYEEGSYVSTVEGPRVIADALRTRVAPISISLLRNQIDDETVSMLLGLKQTHQALVSLCGLSADQVEASFVNYGLQLEDIKMRFSVPDDMREALERQAAAEKAAAEAADAAAPPPVFAKRKAGAAKAAIRRKPSEP